MKEARTILKSIQSGQYAPVYLLQGEEVYYIDLISSYIEKNALDEAAKGFNQVVLYGKDVTVKDVLAQARRFPMMSERQVVIVKEAQSINDLNRESGESLLISYLENPLASTILVFCHKHKSLHKGKKLYKAFQKHAVVLNTKKMYDNQLPDWIRNYFKEKQFAVTDKSVFMLAEYIGNNLERLTHEIDKMLINFKEKVEITDAHIQKYVGISKEYNAFELQKAIGQKEIVRANKIVHYFEANPKANPVIPIISILFLFFSKLLILHASANRNEKNLAVELKVSSFFVKEYIRASKLYPLPKVIDNIRHLRYADLQSKGVNAGKLEDGQILKELVFKLMH